MTGTEQKMPATHCSRYVNRSKAMTTATNTSTEGTARICHITIVHCLLLLLLHGAEHTVLSTAAAVAMLDYVQHHGEEGKEVMMV